MLKNKGSKKPKQRLDSKHKKEYKHAKARLQEQSVGIKVANKNKKKLSNKIISHPELLKLEVLTKGIQNKHEAALNKYIVLHTKAKDEKRTRGKLSKKTADVLSKAKANLKSEKAKLAREIKQVEKLNKLSKGFVYPKTKESDNAIEVNGISKIYATKGLIFEALKDIDISFKRGSFNVILGPSGSGKTTLLNMVSGLDRATAGETIINGTNIQALTTRQITQFRRLNIGFVFQSYNLLSSLNVKDNIEVGRSLQTDPKRRQSIDKLLEEMDMQFNKTKMTYELSGGQQQRVSIARALSKTPDILIGDEPTGALDQKTSSKVFEIFKKINKEFKTTIIVVTHNPNVAELADQVIHVRDGKIDKIVKNQKPKPASWLLNK